MASTKLTLEKQDILVECLMKPFKEERDKIENEFRKFITEFYYDNLIPDEIKTYVKENPRVVNTSHYVCVDIKKSITQTSYDKTISVYFINENEIIGLPSTSSYRNITKALKSKNKYDEAMSLYENVINEDNNLKSLRNKFECTINTNNTPTKLKNNVPVAYKIYVEKFESAKPVEKTDKLETFADIDAEISKYFN